MESKRGRPQVYENGFRQHMIDTKYQQEYYQQNKHVRIECPRCKKDVCKLTISSHYKSKSCNSYS
jgi:hypothetical protein